MFFGFFMIIIFEVPRACRPDLKGLTQCRTDITTISGQQVGFSGRAGAGQGNCEKWNEDVGGKAKRGHRIKLKSPSTVIDTFVWEDLHCTAMWPWSLGTTPADGWSVWFCTLTGGQRRHLLVLVRARACESACACFVDPGRHCKWACAGPESSILHARSFGTGKTY